MYRGLLPTQPSSGLPTLGKLSSILTEPTVWLQVILPPPSLKTGLLRLGGPNIRPQNPASWRLHSGGRMAIPDAREPVYLTADNNLGFRTSDYYRAAIRRMVVMSTDTPPPLSVGAQGTDHPTSQFSPTGKVRSITPPTLLDTSHRMENTARI